MATTSGLIDRVRLELGDQPTSFDISFNADGTSVRYETGQYPLDGNSLSVEVDGEAYTGEDVAVEERTGTLIFEDAPAAGSVIRVRGNRFRFFTATELLKFINDAVAQHTHNRTDAFGRQMTLENMPAVEEYPLALLAATLGLYALLTDASYDIDISAPDGVMIPRSERFRQLGDMVATRQNEYRELCAALNIGLNRIEVFTLRRVSKATGRLVPVYQAKEIDDYSQPIRVYTPNNTYGAAPTPTSAGLQDFVMTQGDSFEAILDFPFDLSGYDAKAQIKMYTGNTAPVLVEFDITTPVEGDNTKMKISLEPDDSRKLPLRSFWDLQLTAKTDATDVQTYLYGSIFAPRQITQ